jgi:hypothetical protein
MLERYLEVEELLLNENLGEKLFETYLLSFSLKIGFTPIPWLVSPKILFLDPEYSGL